MKRVNHILSNPCYHQYLQKIADAESGRYYCKHPLEHLLTVARLTYLLLIEKGNPFISREIAYAAGLLHDIGRWQEYENGTDHADYSAELAGQILVQAGFTTSESNIIKHAIARHRSNYYTSPENSLLGKLLNKADKLSRLCFNCSTKIGCNKIDDQPHKEELLY